MVWAAFTLAFFGFLRCSEFTYQSINKYCSCFDLGTECVSFVPSLASTQHVVITLWSSKTDPFRAGQSLLFARADSSLCAVTAMQHYFQFVAPPPGPLVIFRSGRLLTGATVTFLLCDAVRHAGLPFHSLKGHSFRIGAASSAAAAGLPDWLIKVMGRWSSDCYQLYIKTPTENNCCFLQPHVWPVLLHEVFFFAWGDTCFACICQWRLSLCSDFPKLSSLVFLPFFNCIDLPIFQSDPAALAR